MNSKYPVRLLPAFCCQQMANLICKPKIQCELRLAMAASVQLSLTPPG